MEREIRRRPLPDSPATQPAKLITLRRKTSPGDKTADTEGTAVTIAPPINRISEVARAPTLTSPFCFQLVRQGMPNYASQMGIGRLLN